MNLKFKLKKLSLKWHNILHKKTKLLPDQQNILDNWSALLRDKHANSYYCRVRDERVVVLYEDDREDCLRKMMILKEGGANFYEMLYTEISPNGSKIIIDTELDPQIAKVFIDKFDEFMYRKIISLEKLRKNLVNASLEFKKVEDEIDISNEKLLAKSGVRINEVVKN